MTVRPQDLGGVRGFGPVPIESDEPVWHHRWEGSVAQTDGLPRRNGELVFEAPWEARAFGVAVALCRAHGLDWEEFRGRLIAEIGAWLPPVPGPLHPG